MTEKADVMPSDDRALEIQRLMNRFGKRRVWGWEVANTEAAQLADVIAHSSAFDLKTLSVGTQPLTSKPAALTVWYGSMPESNGKSNWTAILHNGDIASGITLDRSEYPDRVRYEADRARWLIGELLEEPFILDYDVDKHSGYVPVTAPAQSGEPVAWVVYWGIGEMRPNSVHFEKETAVRVAEQIKSNTELRPLYAAPQPSQTAVVLDDERAAESLNAVAKSVFGGINALRWLLNITTEFDRKDVRTRQAARLLDEYCTGEGTSNRVHLERLWKTLNDSLSLEDTLECLRAPDRGGAQPLEQTRALTDNARDAARYRWLRRQQWNEADMFVVAGSKLQVRLGTDCPSLVRLDDAIDAAMVTAQPASGDRA
ncbi:hypothetical protein PQR64_23080 [Paraburkholderia phytofirmans]|uniref:hypothetical protein n=1 Tax=Paraburkholderia phytofirmans TaxID=261302 RepID=UPI0038B76502